MKPIYDFHDPRRHGFVRVGLAQPQVHLSNPVKNLAAHLELINQAVEKGVYYLLFPELSLTGYSNGDLFLQELLLEETKNALLELTKETAGLPVVITVGLPLLANGDIYNVAATLYRGDILAFHPKSYPPNYREFYEFKQFAQARVANFDQVKIDDQTVPFGADIILGSATNDNFKLHVEICEDGWVLIPPSSLAALAGATILANQSASNHTIGKPEYRRLLMGSSSGAGLSVRLYVSPGPGESTADLAWDQDVIIAERGNIIHQTKLFSQNARLIVADVDLEVLTLDRLRQNSFRENRYDNPKRFRTIFIPDQIIENVPEAENLVLQRHIDPHPFVPSDPKERDQRCQEICANQETSLARRLSHVGQGEPYNLVIGVSGGQDSTHALLIAVRAMDRLGWPRQNIIAVTMPGFGTTDRTKRNAIRLIKNLGATYYNIPITKLTKNYLEIIGHDSETEDLTFENSQAWLRKFIELGLASFQNGLVLGTGDLSELALGWCTMFGDHASHYGVNAGVPKTLISYLIRWMAESVFQDEKTVQNTLFDILNTPISPELRRPKNGRIIQKTEEVNGPYELHDFFLYQFTRFGIRPSKIAYLAQKAFDGKYTLAEVKRWLELFIHRFFANQYKRNCLPDGSKVGSAALSPRGDWRMPPDVDPKAWLEDLDNIPV